MLGRLRNAARVLGGNFNVVPIPPAGETSLLLQCNDKYGFVRAREDVFFRRYAEIARELVYAFVERDDFSAPVDLGPAPRTCGQGCPNCNDSADGCPVDG